MSDAPTAHSVPSVDRAWELMELAYVDNGLAVLGWADSMVLTDMPGRVLRFTVHPAPRSHEDEVVIIAVRVPHPDEMSLAEVIGPAQNEGSGTS